MSVLVIAPHPDDDVLGVGATMARFAAEGRKVAVAIVAKGQPPLFDPAFIEQGRQEAREAHRLLGVCETIFLDFPAAQIDEVPHHELNRAMQRLLQERRPQTVFLPFRGDIHYDHQLIFDSAMVALRPSEGVGVEEVYAYETLSETNWYAPRGITPPFVPDLFVRVDDYLDAKLRAMALFRSQLREFPDERSLTALEALARHRGAIIHSRAAEAFMTIRRVL